MQARGNVVVSMVECLLTFPSSSSTTMMMLRLSLLTALLSSAIAFQTPVRLQPRQTIHRSTSTEESPKTWSDDGFVFGLEGSGLGRPKGRNAQVVVEGDSLETKPYQVAMVLATMAGHAGFTGSAIATLIAQAGLGLGLLKAAVLMYASWLLADFGSGVLHWSVDNYGNGKTPIMGSIIAAFQGHHAAPWTITQRSFFNNVYKLCTPFGFIPFVLLLPWLGAGATIFWSTFCLWEVLSQEFHKWSHQLKTETPKWVQWLQRNGFSVDPQSHAQHHLEPFDGNYCIISGSCNKFLDESGFFRRLERIVFRLNGIEPNAWKLDADLRSRTLAGDYSLAPRRS